MTAMNSSKTLNRAPANEVPEVLQRLANSRKCVRNCNVTGLLECLQNKAPFPTPECFQQQYLRRFSEPVAKPTSSWVPVTSSSINGGHQACHLWAKLSIVQAPATFSRAVHEKEKYKDAPFKARLDICADAPLTFIPGVKVYALNDSDVESLETWIPAGLTGLLGCHKRDELDVLQDSSSSRYLQAGIDTTAVTSATNSGEDINAQRCFCASVDFSFDSLMFEDSSNMRPRFLVFVPELPFSDGNPLTVFTLWKIPTIVISSPSQKLKAWKLLWGEQVPYVPSDSRQQTPEQRNGLLEADDVALTPLQTDFPMMPSPDEARPLEMRHPPIPVSLVARELQESLPHSPLVVGVAHAGLVHPSPLPSPSVVAFPPAIGLPAPPHANRQCALGTLFWSVGCDGQIPPQGMHAVYYPGSYAEYNRIMGVCQQQLAATMHPQNCTAPKVIPARQLLQFAAPPSAAASPHAPSPVAAGFLQIGPAAVGTRAAPLMALFGSPPQSPASLFNLPLHSNTYTYPLGFQQPTQQREELLAGAPQPTPTPTDIQLQLQLTQHPQPQCPLETAQESSFDDFLGNSYLSDDPLLQQCNQEFAPSTSVQAEVLSEDLLDLTPVTAGFGSDYSFSDDDMDLDIII